MGWCFWACNAARIGLLGAVGQVFVATNERLCCLTQSVLVVVLAIKIVFLCAINYR
jgi:hypothetical protein